MLKHENHIFSLRCCITALPDFQVVAGLIYSVLLVATHTLATYESLNLVVIGIMGPWLRKMEVDTFALQQLDCVECKMHWCSVLLEHNIVINNAFNSI